MRSREVIDLLVADGWVAVKGSHHQFKHPMKRGRVTVPHPKSEIAVFSSQCGLMPLCRNTCCNALMSVCRSTIAMHRGQGSLRLPHCASFQR